MKPKHLLSAALLLFVAATFGYLISGDPDAAADGADPGGDGAGAAAVAVTPADSPAESPAGEGAAAPSPAKAAPSPRFVAWYLHGSMRCRTCRAIESISHEAVDTAFAGDISDRRLEWRTANFEEAAIEPLAKQFGVTGSSLVIAEMKDGRPVRHALLEGTWDRVEDRRALMEYVVNEIDAFMAAPSGDGGDER